jgi:hypothetical protein
MMSDLRTVAAILVLDVFSTNAAFGDSDQDTVAGISTFLKATQFDAWLAVDYAYNSRGNGNVHIIGQNKNTESHADSHTFQVDQLWFRMDKAVSVESRAGFHADIAFGETARNANLAFGGNDSIAVYTAYVSYLLPGGYGGIRVDAGELWSLLGVEVVAAPENLNITRGLVRSLQPVSNTGLLVSTDVGPVRLALGVVNAPLSDTATDSDRNTSVTGQIGLTLFDDKYDMAVSFMHGSRYHPLDDSGVENPDDPNGGNFPINNDSNKADVTIIDFAFKSKPIEKLDLTLNYDYLWDHPNHGPNTEFHGVAIAARYALTDKIGAAGRFEVVYVKPEEGDNQDEYTFTLTGDYSFNDNLMVRAEVRWDWGIEGKYPRADDPYDCDCFSDDQLLFTAQAMYVF